MDSTATSKMRTVRSENDLMSLVDKLESDISIGQDTATTGSVTTSNDTVADSEQDESNEVDCDQPPPIPSPSPMKKNVSFGTLEQFSFPVVEGDPNFEMAYPMTLGWDCWDESTHDIDDYEANRPARRSSAELRTMSEDRRRIIKDSKKQKKHRRRESIGNGQIGKDPRRGLIPSFMTSSPTTTSSGSGTKDPATESSSERLSRPKRRGTLRRQNSIGNGQISRDPRRNSTQGFLKSLMSGSKQSSKSDSNAADKEPSQELSDGSSSMDKKSSGRRGSLKRQNSIGNGEITRDPRRNSKQGFLSSLMSSNKPSKRDSNSSTKSDPMSDSSSDKKSGGGRRGSLKRQNSIGNGQITRDPRRNSKQGFLMSLKSGSKKNVSESSLKTETPSDTPDTTAPPDRRKGGLKRQNSIGNGEITRLSRRNSVQDFMKSLSFKPGSNRQLPANTLSADC